MGVVGIAVVCYPVVRNCRMGKIINSDWVIDKLVIYKVRVVITHEGYSW